MALSGINQGTGWVSDYRKTEIPNVTVLIWVMTICLNSLSISYGYALYTTNVYKFTFIS